MTGIVEIQRYSDRYRVYAFGPNAFSVSRGLRGSFQVRYDIRIEKEVKGYYPITVENSLGERREIIDIAHSLEEAFEFAKKQAIEYADRLAKENKLEFKNDPRKGKPLEKIIVTN